MEAKPNRIQRKRTKGWRMPEGAVYVGRPSRWGNPFKAGMVGSVAGGFREMTRAEAVELFRRKGPGRFRASLPQLRGKDLVCWCPLDQPCHADVLVEWANE